MKYKHSYILLTFPGTEDWKCTCCGAGTCCTTAGCTDGGPAADVRRVTVDVESDAPSVLCMLVSVKT